MKIIRFLLVGACLLGFSLKAENLDEKTKVKECFYYALPENYFTVTVVIEKINAYKGPLADYANKVTGLSSVVKKDSVYYVIASIKLEEHARMDNRHVFYVEIPNTKGTSYHHLYKDLLISNYDKHTKPLWQKKTSSELDTYNRFNVYSTNDMIEVYDTTYEEQMYDTIRVKIPRVTRTFATKPTNQQALDMVKKIEAIRQARWLLINGEYETDYSKLDLMLSELQKEENEYLSLFGGITEKEELSYTFTIVPNKRDSIITLPLFKFSKRYGISDRVGDMEKINYTLRMTSKGIHEAIENADKRFAESKSSKKSKKGANNNLYYRKPQYFMISLYGGNELLHDFGIYPVSQFGVTVPLPLNAVSFEIEPLTGALKYINKAE